MLPALVVLTAVSGVVDAASYLGLGHVFTANMTGNVVILGFAAAGAPGFSASACLASLAAFVLGAASTGRLGPARSRAALLIIGGTVETALIGVAAVIALAHHESVATGWTRIAVIALLAFAMGMRNAVVRRLAVAEMRTTVLTTTWRGRRRRRRRRSEPERRAPARRGRDDVRRRRRWGGARPPPGHGLGTGRRQLPGGGHARVRDRRAWLGTPLRSSGDRVRRRDGQAPQDGSRPSGSRYMLASSRRKIARNPAPPGSNSNTPSFPDSGHTTTSGNP